MTKKISNKFIESNLQEFAENNGLESLPEFKQFEHLSNYLTISKYHPEAFDSVEVFESVDMDAGSNFGIDGGAILVNGNLLLNESDLSLYSKSKKLELVLIFNQSKTSANFDSGDIAKLGTAVQNFFEENPKIPLSQELIELKNLYNRVLEPDYIRMIDRKRFPRLEMNFITTSRHQADETTRAVSQQMIKNLKTANEDLASVDFNLLGSDYINDTYEDLTNRYTVKIKFDRRIELDSIKDVFGSYIGYLDFSNFLELVTDQNQEIRNNIFYENVRDFQGVDNKVNTEINETLTSDELRDKFILLNNGITVVTKQLTPLQNNEYELGEFQIVNGCQTSNMLYLNREKKSIQNGLFIPIKLIHTQDNEVISKIVKATNRQTPVPDEAFVALDKYHQNLQKFYELTSRELNEKIYYERRSREYQNSDNNIQKYKIVNVHKQIRAFTAIFLNEPHTVASNHPYNILRSKRDLLFQDAHLFEAYFIASYLVYFVNSDITKRIIRGNPFTLSYYIALIMRVLITGNIKLSHFNGKEMENEYKKLIGIITKVEERKKIYPKLFKILNRVKAEFKEENGLISDKQIIQYRSFKDKILQKLREEKSA
ncbi:MAG: AIPR family protein [Leeuwenhoekiella sp.]|jgi:hypothetical protein|uniref:AIPR family protein n=2 Tax=Flavobacteriaceae TaxID=49546 RepID=UPI000C55B87F|nr:MULTISPECIES: AIPR family protein [Leeuwenhoekiella]MAO42956.1 AIPR family protein [Leeuwenhoekiella sp.]HCW63616.1 AIPR family protein [Leeuwenhoekiella sp.]|tara:strand:- start:4102 stop:5898 length:1797 start_codon:yes stop_codon:yes gene_type:complete